MAFTTHITNVSIRNYWLHPKPQKTMNRAHLNKYITLRYYNWLDYAKHMARVHKFEGWADDLLNDVLNDLLKKPLPKLLEMLEITTKKEVNDIPTTELDKFVLNMLKTNAYSPTAPFRKHTLGKKITGTTNGKPDVVQLVPLDKQDTPADEYNHKQKKRMDTMHRLNLARLCCNDFAPQAAALYRRHIQESEPLHQFTEREQMQITTIIEFLSQKQKTVFDA